MGKGRKLQDFLISESVIILTGNYTAGYRVNSLVVILLYKPVNGTPDFPIELMSIPGASTGSVNYHILISHCMIGMLILI